MFHSMSPCLLAALPDTLMLLAMHQKDSAMAFMINKQTQLSFHELMEDLGMKPSIRDRRVLWGGPVSKSSGFLLYEHPPKAPLDEGLIISDTVSVSPSKNLLERAAMGGLPGRFDLILGYMGFGYGQLERELKNGTYLHAELNDEILLNVALSERFHHAFETLGHTPISFMNVEGGAQA